MENGQNFDSILNHLASNGLNNSPKKKKKKKDREKRDVVCSVTPTDSPLDIFKNPAQKKKKKKKDKGNEIPPLDIFKSPSKKKKKKDKGNEIPLLDTFENPSKKKKKKKDRGSEIRASVSENAAVSGPSVELLSDEQQTHRKKKKKRKKKEERENESYISVSDDFNTPPKKKRKEDKVAEVCVSGGEIASGASAEPLTDKLAISPKKKKKRKSKEHEMHAFGNVPCFGSEPLTASPKKKKRKESAVSEDKAAALTAIQPVLEESHMFPKHKSQRKRKKIENDSDIPVSGYVPCSQSSSQSTVDINCALAEKENKERDSGQELFVSGEAPELETSLNPLSDTSLRSPKKKKKKKKKDRAKERLDAECVYTEDIRDGRCGSAREDKKRKRSNQHDADVADTLSADGTGTVLMSSMLTPEEHNHQNKTTGESNSEAQPEDSLSDDLYDTTPDIRPVDKRKSSKFQRAGDDDRPTSGETHSDQKLKHVLNVIFSSSDDEENSEHQTQSGESDKDEGISKNARHGKKNKKNHARKHKRRTSSRLETKRILKENRGKEHVQKTKTTPSKENEGSNTLPNNETNSSATTDETCEKATLCYICQENMASKAIYIQHLAEQHNKRAYQCPKCRRPLSSQKQVEHHLNTCCIFKDSGECMIAPFNCKFCPFSYSNKSNVLRHMRTEHGRGKPLNHKCPRCDREFTTAERALQHKVKCAEGVLKKPHEQNLECHLCGKIYSSKQSRSYHMRTIHANHVFSCVCGKEFRGSAYYYAHRKVCKDLQ